MGAGICNGAKNFVTLAVYLYIPISTAGPIKTGLGMVSAFVVALLLYKERYTKLQLIGVVLGAVAVVLLGLPKTIFS